MGVPVTAWLYADRTAGRHCYYRDFGGDAAARLVKSKIEGAENPMLEQPQANVHGFLHVLQ